MAIDNVRIECSKYVYSDSIALEDCNLFSSMTPTLVRTDNVFRYLHEDSDLKLKYTFDATEKTGSADNTLFYQAGSLDLKFSDLWRIGSQSISEYFEMYGDARRTKWLITVFVNEVPRWKGVINQDAVQLFKHPQSDNYIVEAIAVGLEKEFSDYFSKKKLSLGIGIIEPYNFQIRFFSGTTQTVTPNWCPLFAVLHANFGTSYLNYQIHLPVGDNWHVNYDYPFLYSDNGTHTSANTNYVWMKNSYLRYYEEGWTRWDYFKAVFNSLGYQFFFHYVGSTLMFSIVPRSRNYSLYDYNVLYQDIEGYTVSKTPDIVKYDYVEVPSGLIYGGDEAFLVGSRDLNKDFKGNRATIFSDKKDFVNIHDHFQTVTRIPNSITGSLNIDATTNYKFQKCVNNDSDENYTVQGFTLTNSSSTSESTGVAKPSSLKASTGENRNKYMKVNLSTGVHHYKFAESGDADVGDNDLVFYGNAGQHLFKWSPFPNKFFTYDDYTRTDEYKASFKKFLKSRNNISLSLIYNKLVTDPIINVKVDGYAGEPFNNSGRIYAMSEMTADLINDKTEFSLYQIA